MPSDDINNVHKYKEAPIVDNDKILSDEQTLRERENQSKYVTIPKEVRIHTKSQTNQTKPHTYNLP